MVEWGDAGHDMQNSKNYHHTSGTFPHDLYGNTNCDGGVDISEVIRFLRILTEEHVEYCERRLDFNQTDTVNIADVIAFGGSAPYGDHFHACQKAAPTFYQPLSCERYICRS